MFDLGGEKVKTCLNDCCSCENVPWGIRVSTWIHWVHLLIFFSCREDKNTSTVASLFFKRGWMDGWMEYDGYLFCSCCRVLCRFFVACVCPSLHPGLSLSPALCPALSLFHAPVLCPVSRVSQFCPLLPQLRTWAKVSKYRSSLISGDKLNHGILFNTSHFLCSFCNHCRRIVWGQPSHQICLHVPVIRKTTAGEGNNEQCLNKNNPAKISLSVKFVF